MSTDSRRVASARGAMRAHLTGTARALLGERSEYRLDNGGRIIVQPVYDSADDDSDCTYVAVAWDRLADADGPGAVDVLNQDLATWLSLRWPCTIGGAGFARDGAWYDDGRQAVRS